MKDWGIEVAKRDVQSSRDPGGERDRTARAACNLAWITVTNIRPMATLDLNRDP